MSNTNSTVTSLYCSKCNENYNIDNVINLCKCGSPLLVNYDYPKVSKILTKEMLQSRSQSMWKYREILPVQDTHNITTSGEGNTPLLLSKKIGKERGYPNLYFKDETINPTGSFKARGLSMAVSKAKELNIERLIIPTAGNAGLALAAYGASTNIECLIIMPEDTPQLFISECHNYGAEVKLVKGSIKECGKMASQMAKDGNWFSVATLQEPYRIEGKKTMGYEIAEYFNFSLPDIIIYPTGGGTGLIGMWKAFDEMEKIGWIDGKRPKMIAVQSEGCAPIVKAFEEGKTKADTWENPTTIAAGLRVPSAIGDFLILEAIKESNGLAVAVSESDIIDSTKILSSKEGIFSSPEGGAAMAAFNKIAIMDYVSPGDKIVIFITGNGDMYQNKNNE